MTEVLLISSNHLVAVRLRKLLEETEGLHLVIEQDGDAERIISSIMRCQPEVIVLDKGVNMIDVCQIFDLREDDPRFRVVVVSTDDNHVMIFHKERQTFTQSKDVISMIVP